MTEDGPLGEYDEVVEEMRDWMGDNLRVVGKVKVEPEGASSYDHLYTRDDIDEIYDEDDIRKVGHAFVLSALKKSYRDSLFEHKDLRYFSLGFETAVVVLVFESEREAVSISVDIESGIDPDTVARYCVDILSE
ncbi:MAG: hypothetical protein SV760_03905 [Halobacteria archaeon]|nr:hypothetical protein [Halobacteria archaeon]